MMNGEVSGDTIAYSIQLPSNSSEAQNAGEDDYTSTGTGSTQSIPVVATLQPSQTGDRYPVSDMYMDVVTTLSHITVRKSNIFYLFVK